MDTNIPEGFVVEPCPHCGNTELVGRCYSGQDGFRDRFAILCHYGNGGCGAESGHFHTWVEAVENWNRRDGRTTPATVNLKFRDAVVLTGQNNDAVDWSTWQSPINLAVSQMTTEVHREMDNFQEKLIIEACQRVDVTVDKDELIKAMKYDRDQFKAGWKAGYAKGLVDAWIDPAVKLPEDEQDVFFYDNSGEYHVGWYRAEDQNFDCDSYYVDLVDVLGWQPCVKPKGAPDVTETD